MNLTLLSMAKGKDTSGTAVRDNIRKITNDAGVKVDNARDGMKALADGKRDQLRRRVRTLQLQRHRQCHRRRVPRVADSRRQDRGGAGLM